MILHELIKFPEKEEEKVIDQSAIFKNVYFPLLKDEDDGLRNGILITPTCDILSKGDTTPLLFCAVTNFERLFPFLYTEAFSEDPSLDEFKSTLSETKKKTLAKKLHTLLNGNYLRYQWLGQLPKLSGYWYVDYAVCACYNLKDINKDHLLAIIESPLREAVPTRYANYINRVGLPWEHAERETVARSIIEEYIETFNPLTNNVE